MSTRKKPGLILAGALLGLVLLPLWVAAAALASAGLLAGLALAPPTPAWARQLPRPEDSPGLAAELGQALGSASLGSHLQLPEAELNRLLAAALRDLPAATIQPSRAGLRLTPGAAELAVQLAMAQPQRLAAGFSLRPLTMTARLRLDLSQADGSLVLSLKGLTLGRLPVPQRLLTALAASGRLPLDGLELPEGLSLRLDGPAGPHLVLAYAFADRYLPDLVRLQSVESVEGHLRLGLRLDDRLSARLLATLSPSLSARGGELVAALEASAAAGIDRASLQPALDAAAALASLGTGAAPAQPSALVSFMVNQATVRGADGQERLLDIGDDLYAGSTILTGPGASLELLLRDGSSLYLDENTEFGLDSLPQAGTTSITRLSLVAGRARAVIQKLIDPQSGFEITTGAGVLGVRGTDLVLSYHAGQELTLQVLRGSVALQPPAGEATLVPAGQAIQADASQLRAGLNLPLEPFPLDEATIAALNEDLALSTRPEDEAAIRRSGATLAILEQARRLAAGLGDLDHASLSAVGRQIGQTVDLDALGASLNELRRESAFRELLDQLGLDASTIDQRLRSLQ
ncbi:MAG: hypothetical protein A2087_04365 [Spirochaetes bacterium GWD1_61_31]|nr:MAG: hypothetical protein A2Y37_10930 [Spirochaetes bacterium GWB1_60_80]OHD35443.1 MAG: hypothetical protein A2087_04365 [Spirochaetes bacterium GWD1_61_31]OHD44952.1 MAG: hypothetical protein A2Y35_12970 [Spirochaetes bacterium GWE1_60_18]OHD60062.1 MAG: hypothetical protein A2Y32_11085 [Spirochaetes bacterium GWF1_60_12]HAP43621.1 hypothetical protein [Spirochaetaceae bacterium]